MTYFTGIFKTTNKLRGANRNPKANRNTVIEDPIIPVTNKNTSAEMAKNKIKTTILSLSGFKNSFTSCQFTLANSNYFFLYHSQFVLKRAIKLVSRDEL